MESAGEGEVSECKGHGEGVKSTNLYVFLFFSFVIVGETSDHPSRSTSRSRTTTRGRARDRSPSSRIFPPRRSSRIRLSRTLGWRLVVWIGSARRRSWGRGWTRRSGGRSLTTVRFVGGVIEFYGFDWLLGEASFVMWNLVRREWTERKGFRFSDIKSSANISTA